MKSVRVALILSRHAWLVWRAGQLRFRLETFGLYYPSLPYTAPLWRPSARIVIILARRSVSYAKWVVAMEELRRTGEYSGSPHVGLLWRQVENDLTLTSRPES